MNFIYKKKCHDLHTNISKRIVYYENKYAIYIAKNVMFHERMKHIKIHCLFVHTKLQECLIHLFSLSSSN